MSIAYFFCKEDVQLLNDAHQLIRTFIHQITIRNALETRNLAQAIWANSASIANSTASINEWVELLVMPLLRSLFESKKEIVFIVDGLNELSESNISAVLRFFEKLQTTTESQIPVIKIIVTSQATTKILGAMENAPKIPLYGLNEHNIEKYVEQTLGSNPSLQEKFQKAGIDAASHFKENHHGMFLWVSIVLNVLKETPWEKYKTFLEQVPTEIDGVYSEMLKRTRKKLERFELDLLKEILGWVSMSTRDIFIRELRIGIALARPHGPISESEITIDAIDAVLGKCGAFLQIVPNDSAPEKRTVSLIHGTFKRYITDPLCEPSLFHIDTARTSAMIARTSLLYLSQKRILNEPESRMLLSEVAATFERDHPFFLFSTNWNLSLRQARQVSGDESELIKLTLIRFFEPESLVNWIESMLAYSFAGGNVWITRDFVLWSLEDVIKWLEAHDLRVSVLDDALNIVSDKTSLEASEMKLYLWAARAAATAWLRGNPKYFESSKMAFRISFKLAEMARGHTNLRIASPNDIERITGLARDLSPCDASWREANIAHAYDLRGSEKLPKEERISSYEVAIKKFSSLLSDSDLNVNEGKMIWCALCDTTMKLTYLTGVFDVRELARLHEKVEPERGNEEEAKTFNNMEVAETSDRISTLYLDNFEWTRSKEQLDAAIYIGTNAFNMLSDEYVGKVDFGLRLSFALYRKFELEGDIDVLNSAIDLAEYGEDRGNLQQKVRAHYHLGFMLGDRYYMQRSKKDGDDAFRFAELAYNFDPDHHEYVNGLALQLNRRFHRTSSIADLDRGIREIERILNPDDPIYFCFMAFNLCDALHVKQLLGSIELSTKKLDLAAMALSCAPKTVAHMPSWQISYAIALMDCYETSMDLKQLRESYKAMKNTMGSIQESTDVIWKYCALSLANSCLLIFDHTGEIDCLNEAVELSERALQCSRTHYVDEASTDFAFTFSDASRKRFEEKNDPKDLEEAQKYSELALRWNKRDWIRARLHSLRGLVLLGASSSTLPDLNDAITQLKTAVTLAQRHYGKARQAWHYYNLSVALRRKFEISQVQQVLEESREFGWKAIDALTEPHIDAAKMYNSLANSLVLHFKLSNSRNDLFEAASCASIAVNRIPNDHVRYMEYFKTLEMIMRMAKETGDENLVNDLDRHTLDGTSVSIQYGLTFKY